MQTTLNLKRNHKFIFTNDQGIREAFKASLINEFGNNPKIIVIEELGIDHGAARIDLAVINGDIHGYEFKSDIDTLNRLPHQVKIYNSVLDKITLIVGKNHLHQAIKIIPDWWGIKIAKVMAPNQEIVFYNIRAADRNPSQDKIAIARLLWREEALNILEKIGKADGIRSKTRNSLYMRLAEVLDTKDLRLIVREIIYSRTNWRSDSKYTLGDD